MASRFHCITFSIVAAFVCVFFPHSLYAATLKLSPETGVYTVGGTFTASILVNTAGKPINAAEGTLSYNPRELQVLGLSKNGSIFNLWTIEPSFSNTTGKVTFGGGSPSGYTGSSGMVAAMTFKILAAGTPKVTFSTGSVLAADGQGTNVLSGMSGGAYTTSAKSDAPTPEYVAPANTPLAPRVVSSTHPEADKWYTQTTAKLSWIVPSDVTSIRTLLDTTKGTIPTLVHDATFSNTEIKDLKGVSYFHIQFKNADGWGRVTQYRLAVDDIKPESFDITLDTTATSGPKKRLLFTAKDSGSGIASYIIQIDGGEKIPWIDTDKKSIYQLPILPPGEHTIVAEAIDFAQNKLVSSFSFSIEAFEAPVFTDYPSEIQQNIIPVFKGTTRKDAKVFIKINMIGAIDVRGSSEHEVRADANGNFTFVPDTRLSVGVYEVTARAVDLAGSESRVSDAVRIAVQESNLKRVGGTAVTILSVVVPLIALLVLLVLVVMYGILHARKLRARLRKEVTEAERSLAHEFESIVNDLHTHVEHLKEAKQGKYTRAETALLSAIADEIETAKGRVAKEIQDVERILGKR